MFDNGLAIEVLQQILQATLTINPAKKYPKARHSGEGRNPEKHWMPDQVRHDGFTTFNRRINNSNLTKILSEYAFSPVSQEELILMRPARRFFSASLSGK